ncbi:MAG: GatB/YqeY domain-containing protein [Anaerolineae bacterium]|nr:GatB/YqeY domain-containing protein [Anaerolineae bacterium]
MEDPKAQLQGALKQAMIEKDIVRRNVIRMAMSAIKQAEVDSRKELNSDDVMAVLQKEAKTRRETIEEQEKAGYTEDAEKGKEELAILESFLPRQLSREELEVLAQDAIQQSGASSMKDMGKIMGLLMPKVKGKADGNQVNQVVRELLNKSS